VFIGKTKKIAFAGEMEAVKVIPIQAVTCVVYTALALACSALFFHRQFALAFALSLVGSQLWRVYSETLRADYRGGSRLFSVYQMMALLAALYGIAISLALPDHAGLSPDLAVGLGALWSPGVILSLQVITVAMFFFSGTSTITTGELRFGLAADWRSQAGCDEEGCQAKETRRLEQLQATSLKLQHEKRM